MSTEIKEKISFVKWRKCLNIKKVNHKFIYNEKSYNYNDLYKIFDNE